MSSVYLINKGVNKPISFRGLRGQYIWWLCIGVVVLLLVFVVLYIGGVALAVCLGVCGILGTLLFVYVYRYSRKYGEHGLMKRIAQKSVPRWIRSDKTFGK